MNEVDNVPQQQDNMRPKILKTLKRISHLKYDEITSTMPAHRVEKWKELLTSLENLTSCFQKKPHPATSKEPNVPVTCSRDAISSTSGQSRDVIASTSGVSRHAITTNI